MTSAEIRQSFLDFFQSKQHTIVTSSSLMPDSPNLLFTNAGMNQFVPIFLGERAADVDKWAGAVTNRNTVATRAADTQKCIRAGGKHNDLEDVGLDTYHHTFFEMLGNWSFGDYFKREAIEWAWELVTGVWQFPKQRIYATVFCPHMDMERWRKSDLEKAIALAKSLNAGTAVTFDEGSGSGAMSGADVQAATYWATYFLRAGLDPAVHIVPGNKRDNFWMMGDTGPCGPCSELHVDLTQNGDTKGALVNKGSSECIEIWNLVFIQFNANPDGTFSPLPAKHVDTGMGFERVTSIMQCTKNFTDFGATISNYETDIFRPLFDRLEQMSGKQYTSTLPREGSIGATEQEKIDVAFRVIADHIRTLSFSIADGIQPGNTDRNYVLRRILRRAVKYGRTLGFHEPFFYKLVGVLAEHMGHVFPEVRAKQKHIEEVIHREEEAFNRTLDRGIELFGRAATWLTNAMSFIFSPNFLHGRSVGLSRSEDLADLRRQHPQFEAVALESLRRALKLDREKADQLRTSVGAFERVLISIRELDANEDQRQALLQELNVVTGKDAFELYDTYGFPLDLTELMARERGLSVDVVEFNRLMDEQRERARKAQKKQVIELSQIETGQPTRFIGFEQLDTPAKVLEVVQLKDKTAVILDQSACYAEMGGQLGDTGELSGSGQIWRIADTRKTGNTFLHFIEGDDAPAVGQELQLTVDAPRRAAIQRHHTVTHLFHWALHEVVSRDASQKGSYVGPEKLTFDFNCAALTPQQVNDVERLVNERILENADVSWTEVPFAEARDNKDIMQLFGEKYGDRVRVVQIGGKPGALNGYSMELCGGTHTRHTGEIGLFRIVAESAIAAGVRRIEAIAGLESLAKANADIDLIKSVAGKLNSPVGELEKKVEAMLAQQKRLEKELKSLQQAQAAANAKDLIAKARDVKGVKLICENLGEADGNTLQTVADALKGEFEGVVVLGGVSNGAVSLVATVSASHTKQVQAGRIIQTIAPIVGGKGGGRPDNARGGGKDAAKLNEALAKVVDVLG